MLDSVVQTRETLERRKLRAVAALVVSGVNHVRFASQGHFGNRASNGSVLEVNGMTDAGPPMSGKGGLVK
jgi:hypothetical protein